VLANVIVAPLPLVAGVIAPETAKVGNAAAAKFTAERFAPFMVTVALAGVNPYPNLLGVTV
jgi:hypothetical protein